MPGQNGSAHLPGTYVPLPCARSPRQALTGASAGSLLADPERVRYVRDNPKVRAIGDKSPAHVKTTTVPVSPCSCGKRCARGD